MRKLLPIFILSALVACRKSAPAPLPESPVTKKIEYHIFAGKDYSAPVYGDIKADVRLQIRRINYRTGETELLWDSVFTTRNITDFPQYLNKIVVRKFYPVYESRDKLNGSCSIKYNQSGAISQEGWSDEVVPGQMSILLEAVL